ncbi:ncs1 allantoate transporter [Moniliophthora roreri]|nr:ncs1 allantoate transporter [Moniliophthora roreri]
MKNTRRGLMMPGLTVASFLFHRIGEDGIPEYYEYWALGSLDLKKWFCDPTGHVIQPFHVRRLHGRSPTVSLRRDYQ